MKSTDRRTTLDQKIIILVKSIKIKLNDCVFALIFDSGSASDAYNWDTIRWVPH